MKIDLVKSLVHFFVKNKPAEKLDGVLPPEKFQTILCMSTTAIGDTLFYTPLYRALKKKYPEKRIIALLNQKYVSLFKNNPNIDKIYTWRGKWINFFQVVRTLRKEQIDVTLMLHSNEPQATPLALLSGAQYVISIPNINNPLRHLHSNPPTGWFEDRHLTFDKLKQLEYLGIKADDPRMDLFVEEAWRDEVKSFLQEKIAFTADTTLVGFQIGASGLERMWPPERWVELGKMILRELPNSIIVLTGAPHEKKLTAEVACQLPKDKVADAAGNLSLEGAAALIATLNLLVTPDTGPLQIAAATRTPTVSLFALAIPVRTHPCFDSKIHLCIEKPVICDPCLKKKCQYAKCMAKITVDEVFAVILMLLGKKKIDPALLVKNDGF